MVSDLKSDGPNNDEVPTRSQLLTDRQSSCIFFYVELVLRIPYTVNQLTGLCYWYLTICSKAADGSQRIEDGHCGWNKLGRSNVGRDMSFSFLLLFENFCCIQPPDNIFLIQNSRRGDTVTKKDRAVQHGQDGVVPSLLCRHPHQKSHIVSPAVS